MLKFEEIMNYDCANRIVYNSLCEDIKRDRGILPFVGAGISAFTYKTWESLLISFASELEARDNKSVIKAIKDGKYFVAADIICDKFGEIIFYNKILENFSEDKIKDDEIKENAIYYVPQLCKGDCITTNYDRLLEHACRLNNIVPDRAIPSNINQLNIYLRNGSSKSGLIFKIHGDILSNREDIILTGKSYENHYGKESCLKRELIKWIDSRKILFLGASLKKDYTVEIIKSRMEEGMYNYAIYGCEKNEISQLKRHFESMNILALFYDSTDHDNLRIILSKIIEDTKQ